MAPLTCQWPCQRVLRYFVEKAVLPTNLLTLNDHHLFCYTAAYSTYSHLISISRGLSTMQHRCTHLEFGQARIQVHISVNQNLPKNTNILNYILPVPSQDKDVTLVINPQAFSPCQIAIAYVIGVIGTSQIAITYITGDVRGLVWDLGAFILL